MYFMHFLQWGVPSRYWAREWGCPQRAVSTGALESDLGSAPCGSISLKRGP